MYEQQPTTELTLYDFEVVALNRLRVLKAIETAKAKTAKPEELDALLKVQTNKHLGGKLLTEEARRNDAISHHILRLAYCQSEEKRRWFIAQETALFRWRLQKQSAEQVADFMRKSDMSLEQIDDEERETLARDLAAVWATMKTTSGVTDAEWAGRLAHEPVFKVPFTQALELVASRRALVRGGFAYVPRERLTHIIVGRFRTRLSLGLVQASKALPAVLRDERLGPVLGNMSKAYLGPQYGEQGGALAGAQVRAVEVAGLAGTSFPLCMSALQSALSGASHLKHEGRMQYGLFLKGIGLGLEEAMVFWQGHFTKKMTAEEFVKRYAYNIRHNYGKEGKRANYTPYSCVRIIMGTPPGAGEVHGCPYRHWDPTNVRKALVSRGLSGAQVERVMASVKERNFQIACRNEFEARMGLEDDSVGQHPNGYFEACQRVIKDKAGASGAAAAASAGASADGAPAAPAPAPAASAAASSGGFSAASGAVA
ncbi:hypothetical protein FNF31_04161 [Cafeteria roenbergensis]|nr:hypothetical protein FNF31_04161 [Cafeteria roenbergensis]